MKKTTNPLWAMLQALLLPVAVLGVLLLFGTALENLTAGSREESLAQLEAALRQASVACYAAEGIYPPSLEYLQQHYGIQIDEGSYVVYYDIFAENLMPDITVLEIKK